MIEEDDRVAGVEREKVDVAIRNQPSTFSTGTYSILCAWATPS